MGEARRKGTFEERKAMAIDRHEKELAERRLKPKPPIKIKSTRAAVTLLFAESLLRNNGIFLINKR